MNIRICHDAQAKRAILLLLHNWTISLKPDNRLLTNAALLILTDGGGGGGYGGGGGECMLLRACRVCRQKSTGRCLLLSCRLQSSTPAAWAATASLLYIAVDPHRGATSHTTAGGYGGRGRGGGNYGGGGGGYDQQY